MRLGIALSCIALTSVGCGSQAKDTGITELETVDIDEAIDAELSTEADERGRQVVAAVSGVLPTDIPVDLPIYAPSSLVDFGDIEGGLKYVAVDTSGPVEKVRGEATGQLGGAGWQVVSETESSLEIAKASQSVTVTFEDLKPGTRVRYQYTPRQ